MEEFARQSKSPRDLLFFLKNVSRRCHLFSEVPVLKRFLLFFLVFPIVVLQAQEVLSEYSKRLLNLMEQVNSSSAKTQYEAIHQLYLMVGPTLGESIVSAAHVGL